MESGVGGWILVLLCGVAATLPAGGTRAETISVTIEMLSFVPAEVHAKAGDFVNIPRGTVHCFFNDGTWTARMIVTFTPAGMEGFFEETLEPATDRNAAPPQNNSALVARYVAAAAKYGLEFVPVAQATAA